MSDEPYAVPTSPRTCTMVVDGDGLPLARLEQALWPPIGSMVELTAASREVVVIDVRLQLPLVDGAVSHVLVIVDNPEFAFEAMTRGETTADVLA